MVLGLAALFPLFGGLAFGYSSASVVTLAIAGLFLGAIAAPELQPEAFRRPRLWQTGWGALAGAATAAAFGSAPVWIGAGVVVGSLLGASARFWLEHVQIP